MEIIEKYRFVRKFISNALYITNKQKGPRYEKDRMMGEILRYTHSIEKGLSLENVRKGFGVEKIKLTTDFIERYVAVGGSYDDIPVRMFIGALSAYLGFHKNIGYSDANIQEIQGIYDSLKNRTTLPTDGLGGIITVNKIKFEGLQLDAIKRLFNERHSVREFSKTPVDMNVLQEAIELAMRCPSACNRQCYRVHVVHKSAFPKLENWMDGIGGFRNDIDKLLIITGNASMYRVSETYQHVVTATVFASYLTLSLQALGIGSCFVQRDVVPNARWTTLQQKLNIPGNEEVVCCIGVGNLKDEYKAPISNRLPIEMIASEIK